MNPSYLSDFFSPIFFQSQDLLDLKKIIKPPASSKITIYSKLENTKYYQEFICACLNCLHMEQ